MIQRGISGKSFETLETMDSHFRSAGVHFVHQANLPDNGTASCCAKNISHYETVKLIEKYEIESRDQTTRDEVTALALTARRLTTCRCNRYVPVVVIDKFIPFFHPHKCNEACN